MNLINYCLGPSVITNVYFLPEGFDTIPNHVGDLRNHRNYCRNHGIIGGITGILLENYNYFEIQNPLTFVKYSTVLIQIFEGRIFHWCHKFSIFAILFSRITGFRHSIISMLRIINWGLNFRGPHVIHKNSEINVPRKFVRVRYIYVNSVKAKLYRIKTLTTS